MAKTAYKGTKNPHLIIISEEIFLVNKIENAVNTGLDFGGLNFQTSGLDFVSRLLNIGIKGKTAPQTLNMIERLSAESVQQKQGFRENHSTFARVKN